MIHLFDVALMMLLAFMAGCTANEYFHQSRRKPRRRIRSGQLFLVLKGTDMSKGIIRVDQNSMVATLVFKDAKGNAANPASPPVWSMTQDGIASMTVADDGMSATFVPSAVGDTTVNVTAEGDAVAGVDTVLLSGDISVVAAEIATGELSFAAPT